MAILLQDPCDNLTFAPWATTAGTPTITAGGHTGNGISINTTTSIAYNVAAGSRTDYLTVGCWIKFSAIPGSNAPFMRWRGDAGATTHVTLQIFTTHISFIRTAGSAVLGTSVPHGMTPGNWYYVEASVKLSDTAGQCICRINGTAVITTSAAEDTKSGGTGTVLDQFGLVGGTGLAHIVDDVYVRNDATFGTAGVAATGTGAITFGGTGALTSAPPVPPVIPAPPAGVFWRAFNVWRGPPAQRNTVLGELVNLRSLRLHFDLNAPATASCTLDGRSSGAASLQELSQDLCLYRWNPYTSTYVVMFRGPIGHTQDQVSETTHALNVQAADYRALLARRPVGGPLTFTNTDQFNIANGLVLGAGPIDVTTPPYNMGISAPLLRNPDGTTLAATGVNRDRTYLGPEKTADMLDNLASVVNGFEWGAEPVDPVTTPSGFASQTYVWFPQRGVAKTFVADYGATVATLSRSVDSTGFSNWVRNDGTNDEAGLPLYAVAAGDVIANPQLHPEGWWPRAISNPSTADPTTLQEQADGTLALESILVPSYTLALVPGVWHWKTDAWLGDTIEVRVRSGRLNVRTQVRIIQVDITVDDTGIERTALTVARTVPTLADVLISQRSELDALSRR